MKRTIITIGASSGGVSALTALLAPLPKTFSLPIVLVLHRAPDSDLVSLVQKRTLCPVCEPEDKQLILARQIYLAPPDYHLLVDRERFHLSIDEPVEFARPSINVLFESAAEAFGAETVGVILSGANQDGAKGAERIFSQGGEVFIQDVESAESPAMPEAARSAVPMAKVAPLDVIGKMLLEFDTDDGSWSE